MRLRQIAATILLSAAVCGQTTISGGVMLNGPIISGASSNGEQLLFYDDFESGNTSKWTAQNCETTSCISIVSSPVHGGTKALQILYNDPADIDMNNYLHLDNVIPYKGLYHIKLSVYVPSPSTGGADAAQRKKLYLKSDTSCTGSQMGGNRCWEFVVSHFYIPNSNQVQTIIAWDQVLADRITVPSFGKGRDTLYSTYSFNELDQWHTYDLYLKLNTPGQQNGYFQMFVDGTDISATFAHSTTCTPAALSCSQNLELISSFAGPTDTYYEWDFGMQEDPWTNCAVSTASITSTSQTGNTVTVTTASACSTGPSSQVKNGWDVVLSGSSNALLNITCTNAQVVSNTQFTCTNAVSQSQSGTGGSLRTVGNSIRAIDDIFIYGT